MSTSALVVTVAALAAVRLFGPNLLGDALAVVAAGLVVARFAAGDPPRVAWLLRLLAVGLVAAAHGVRRGGAGGTVDLALLIVANLLGAAAIVGFLRVVRASGLVAPWTARARLALAGLALVAAGVVAAILADAVRDPSLRAATLAVSTVCNAVVFVGSAALLHLVLSLRGGAVATPFLLLAVDGLCYLLVDLGHARGGPWLADALPGLEALGGAAGTSAGLAQFALLRRAARPLPRAFAPGPAEK